MGVVHSPVLSFKPRKRASSATTGVAAAVSSPPPVAAVWSFSGPSSNAYTTPWSKCEGDGDVVGVVAPLFAEVRRFLHGDQVVELSVLLEVHEKEEVGENGEGSERGELKERRTCTWMDMTGLRT